MSNLILSPLRSSFLCFNCLILLGIIVNISCSNNTDTDELILPSELSISITITGASVNNPTGDGSGEVRIIARAQNTVRYAFRINNQNPQQNNSGILDYIVTQEGTHTYILEVLAYSESGQSISESTTFEVYKEDASSFNLIFADEFDYEGAPDPDKWHHQIIPILGDSWANGELQHYTARIENSYVSSGTLKIKAIKENYTYNNITKSYTSARLNSKFAFTYGRVEVRAKLPAVAGTWPAIWTLGANINEIGNYFGSQYGSVGWPACGEIDIMEQRGWDKDTTIGYFHWGDTFTGEYKNAGGDKTVANTSTEYHVYTLDWDSNSMKISVDETLIYELPNTSDKPFDNAHYLLLNIAMGGNLGGEVPANFTEDVMEIDYVRVYQ